MTREGGFRHDAGMWWLPFLGANLALASLYVLLGRFALLQAVPPGFATLIFFPSGIALAAIVSRGPGLLPGIALGAFALNLSASADVSSWSSACASSLVALASTLQAYAGARLFRHYCSPALATGRDVLRFLLLTPCICLVAATLSVAGLYALGLVSSESMRSNWIFWWAGDTIGIIVAAPLSWLVLGAPKRLWRARRWLLALPLCICSAAFVFMYTKVNALEQRQQQHQFILHAQQLADVFQFQFSEHERLLYAMGSVFFQRQETSPESFSHMARSYLDNRPELRLISWAPRVAGAQRAEFERWGQAAIASDFMIRQYAGGQMLPAESRPQYFVTSFVEPLSGNERVLGMDMLSEPIRAAMVRKAMASKRPSASEPLRLVQASEQQYGILLAQMVYPPNAAPDQAPAGMLVAVLQVAPYIAQTLAQTAFSGLEMRFEDVTAPAQPVLLVDAIRHAKPYELVTRQLTLGERRYRIAIGPSDGYKRANQGWLSWGALGSGMLLTGLLGAFLLLISGQREQIENQVVERTRELREREARLKAILDGAAEAILTVDRTGRLLSANGAAERLFGQPAERLRQLAFGQLVPQGLDDAEQLLQAASTQSAAHREGPDLLGRRADGNMFPLAMEASLVRLPDESFWVCMLRDLSEQRRAEQQIAALEALKQTQNELMVAEKMASLGSLVTGVAHELNTPVGNSLLAASSLGDNVLAFQLSLKEGGVRRSDLEAHLSQALQASELITGSLHRVADLISTFKQVAVDRTIDQRRDFDLLTVCKATLDTHARALRRANCEIVWSVPPGLQLHSYPGSLSQVINALANNALLHAFSGRGAGKIQVCARELADDTIELVFKDDGVGMAPEVLRRVFDPFFTTKLGQGSSGLGMSIVYNLVTGMLGGHIALQSVPGQGTSVCITMPRNGAASAEVERASPFQPQGIGAKAADPV